MSQGIPSFELRKSLCRASDPLPNNASLSINAVVLIQLIVAMTDTKSFHLLHPKSYKQNRYSKSNPRDSSHTLKK